PRGAQSRPGSGDGGSELIGPSSASLTTAWQSPPAGVQWWLRQGSAVRGAESAGEAAAPRTCCGQYRRRESRLFYPSLIRGGTMPKTTTPNSTPSTAPVHTLAPKTKKWRVVDYVTTAVLGIAVGLVFWVLALSWKVLELAFQAFPPSIGLIAGLW